MWGWEGEQLYLFLSSTNTTVDHYSLVPRCSKTWRTHLVCGSPGFLGNLEKRLGHGEG